jgi:hypothetical protein
MRLPPLADWNIAVQLIASCRMQAARNQQSASLLRANQLYGPQGGGITNAPSLFNGP